MMALETLANVNEIGGVAVHRVNWKTPAANFIEICDAGNAITFKVQDGPIGKVGPNGCQVDHIVMAARHIISELNKKFPCRENALAITKLDESLMWLEARTKDRTARGVEGTNQT